jgi:hypothetical protein
MNSQFRSSSEKNTCKINDRFQQVNAGLCTNLQESAEQSDSHSAQSVPQKFAGPSRYRVEREASEERAWQQLVNILRRLAGLRINRTGQQAYDDHLEQAVAS